MISLVTATYGRYDELVHLLESLKRQTNKNFELILVDQNDDNRLEILCSEFKNYFTIKYIHSDIKGLSYNRNFGLKYVSGNIVAFPDDDCYYSPEVIDNVYKTYSKTSCNLLLIPSKDFNFNDVIPYNSKRIGYLDIMKNCISYNLFIRNAPNLFFDNNLGVGSYFGSGEETDFIWRNLPKSSFGIFVKGCLVFHPANLSKIPLDRAYKYALGFGAIYKKQWKYNKNISLFLQYVYYLFRSIGGIMFTPNRILHYVTLKGRIKGFLEYK